MRLVGLPEAVEGSDVVSFLQQHFRSWIHALAGHEIPIKRASLQEGKKWLQSKNSDFSSS